jgi:hypothetical protein
MRKISVTNMLRTVLAHCVSYTRFQPQQLLNDFEDKARGAITNELTNIPDILSYIKECVQSLSKGSELFLVIDGLNECGMQEKQKMAESMGEVCSWEAPSLHLLLLARTEFFCGVMERFLHDTTGNQDKFNLSSSNRQDIDTYLKHLGRHDHRFSSYSNEIKDRMCEVLGERSQGKYVYVIHSRGGFTLMTSAAFNGCPTR